MSLNNVSLHCRVADNQSLLETDKPTARSDRLEDIASGDDIELET